MKLAVEPLSDADAINGILQHETIAPKLRHDGREPGYIDHPAASYYGAYIDNRLVGVFLAIRFSKWEVQVHVGLLPEAIRYGRSLADLFLAQVFVGQEVQRATGYVLSTLPTAANFCRKLGFEHEGTRRQACRVNGALVDIHILGLTRENWQLRAESH
ncbi:GNAT family N-acetyltransferase [Allosphingosinicella flava]|uniref:GNAT family N-acetyltransferase n=1 Tax=Allosphingosinicella flava TaxID=2771430 RepID=A0A7T2LMS7_9SPHN|nr:GNAT family protein [Sphingosinicella flava]QPQ55598.1 GNAT family N-acetyltransferase [Sphingosinicella flava]